jgi:hypothetical protein
MTALVPDSRLPSDSLDDEPARESPVPDSPGPTSRRRLYLASAAVVAVVVAAALVAPWALTTLRASGRDDSGGVYDDFERDATDGLGAIAGQEWEDVSGAFEIIDGVAVLSNANDVGPRSIALLDVGATNGRIIATAGKVTPGWGIVFRYSGPFDYWYVQAAPDYAVLNVVRVMGGEAQVIGPTSLAAVQSGTEVEILLHGADIEVRVDGDTVFVITNNHALGAHRAGLLALGEPDGASWESFRAIPDETDPGPGEVGLNAPAVP